MFQCSSPETTSVDRAGNLRKHTFRRFQVWNPGTLAGTASVPACSSVPAVGQIEQLVKAAGAGRGNLRARTARSRGFDRHHQTRSGSWVVHQQVVEVLADEVVAEHSPSHCHLLLAHWNTRLFHGNTRANPSVPDQIVAQRPETHNAHIFSVI